jgi:hypothetical protein
LTLLRPVRKGDRGSLPLVFAVATIGITQEVLGTPLTSWAIGAAVYLLARPDSVYGTDDERTVYPRTGPGRSSRNREAFQN